MENLCRTFGALFLAVWGIYGFLAFPIGLITVLALVLTIGGFICAAITLNEFIDDKIELLAKKIKG